MKAYSVSEKLDFERGGDPKRAMGIGVKTRLLDIFPKAVEIELSDHFETWKKIKDVINKPTTQVKFEIKSVKRRKYNPKILTENLFVTIKLPDNEMNFFLFKSIQAIIDSHTPKQLYHFGEKDNEVTYYIPNKIN